MKSLRPRRVHIHAQRRQRTMVRHRRRPQALGGQGHEKACGCRADQSAGDDLQLHERSGCIGKKPGRMRLRLLSW